MSKITVSDGTKINYYLDDFTDPWLECDTVVILHGCGETAKLAYRLVPGFARKYKVLRIDERGVGESGMPPGGYKVDIERFAEDVLNVIDQLGVEKIHLFGFHSGGWVGAMFAISYPNRTKSLTLCNSPYKGPGDMDGLFSRGEKDAGVAIKKLGFREWAKGDSQSLAWEQNVPPKMREWSDNERGKNPSDVSIKDYNEIRAARYAWALYPYDWRYRLKEIKVPTLILTGAKCRLVSPEMASAMQKEIPNAQLTILANAVSNINFFHADRCVEVVLHFLQSIEG